VGIAVAAFLVTRALASSNRAMSLRDAAEWYRRGQAGVTSGRISEAVTAFRHATVRDRSNKEYALALARALALNGSRDAARAALLTLREASPEDRDINLELARLAVQDRDVPEALRFYHNTLYAPWGDLSESRRNVRLELIRFLLTNGQKDRAQAELLALSSDLPDDVAHHVEVAQLFAQSDDATHALEEFRRALGLDPGNDVALAGAGLASFQLGQYRLAQGYLRRAAPTTDDVRETRALVDLVVASDPWAARIGSAERRRRLVADLSYARNRLETCLASRAGKATEDEAALQSDTKTFAELLTAQPSVDQEAIENGFDVIARIERTVLKTCGPATPVDRALSLIGRQHGGDPR